MPEDKKDIANAPYIPFSDQGNENINYGRNEAEKTKSQKEVGDTTNAAADETTGEYEKVHNTPGTDLNKGQNYNYAKTGGQYGHINNRSYAKTLKLAREADAYNNEPVAHTVATGTFRTGGAYRDMGVPYEKPKVQTMETRAMDQAFQLDTNRKMAEQALQAAVARKDLDAFIAAYQQRYGIVLTREQANLEMIKYLRQTQIADYFQKNWNYYKTHYDRYFSAETARAVDDLVRTGNGQFAMFLAKILTGYASRSTAQAGDEMIVKQKMINKYGSKAVNGNWTAEMYADREKFSREHSLEYLSSMIAQGLAIPDAYTMGLQ